MYKCQNCGKTWQRFVSDDMNEHSVVLTLCLDCRVKLEKAARRTCEEDS